MLLGEKRDAGSGVAYPSFVEALTSAAEEIVGQYNSQVLFWQNRDETWEYYCFAHRPQPAAIQRVVPSRHLLLHWMLWDYAQILVTLWAIKQVEKETYGKRAETLEQKGGEEDVL